MADSKWNAGRRTLIRAGMVLGLAVRTSWALAAYPDKPIKLIVPYPPGGATDVIGRIVALNKDAGITADQ